MAIINQDLGTAQDKMSFDPVPEGWYHAHLTETEMRTTKNGDSRLSIRWTILDGPCAKRTIYDSVMLSGSRKAVDFGRNKLKTIARCVGHRNPNYIADSDELLQMPCYVRVAVTTYNDSPTNDVKDYESEAAWRIKHGGGQPAQPAPAPRTAQAPPPAAQSPASAAPPPQGTRRDLVAPPAAAPPTDASAPTDQRTPFQEVPPPPPPALTAQAPVPPAAPAEAGTTPF